MSSNLQRPALDPASIVAVSRSIYPEPMRQRVAGRQKQALGNACGLSQFGVNLTTLPPGAESSLRHWHTQEDEFVYVLSGSLVLVSDAGEQTLQAGQCAGFPAGSGDGHHFINRSDAPAQYLEIGSRNAADCVHYPDDDLQLLPGAEGYQILHKDGRPY